MKHRVSMFSAALLGAVLFGVCAVARAQTFDVNLSNDSALFRYIVPIGGGGGFGTREADLGFLYTTDDDVLAMLGFQIVDEAGSASPGLDAGVGLKAFAATSDNDDILAVSLGGTLHYTPPAFSRLGFLAEGFLSPDIVTFVDAKGLAYVATRVEYEILPQASVYLGYRKVRADIERRGKVTIESGGHVGIQLLF